MGASGDFAGCGQSLCGKAWDGVVLHGRTVG